MDVDTPPSGENPPVRPGTKRTYTGELASSPLTPGEYHGNNMHHIISQVFRVAYMVRGRKSSQSLLSDLSGIDICRGLVMSKVKQLWVV